MFTSMDILNGRIERAFRKLGAMPVAIFALADRPHSRRAAVALWERVEGAARHPSRPFGTHLLIEGEDGEYFLSSGRYDLTLDEGFESFADRVAAHAAYQPDGVRSTT